MEERRQHVRRDLNLDISLYFDGITVPCIAKNLSMGGALLVIDPLYHHNLSETNIGATVECRYNTAQNKGKIIRILKNEGIMLLAIRYE